MLGPLIRRLESFERPPPMLIFLLVVFSYFLVTAGIAYDIIHEPPAVGGVTDPVTGAVRPVTFMPYRINGQYIIEGLSGGFMYTLGGLGIVLLDVAHNRGWDKTIRFACLCVGGVSVLFAYAACMVFIRIKMPGYLK